MILLRRVLLSFPFVKWLKDQASHLEGELKTERAWRQADLNTLQRRIQELAEASELIRHLHTEVEEHRRLRMSAESSFSEAKADAKQFKDLFLEEKAAHQHALELVADWEAQRLLGRQIFHHAPLLQPDKPNMREHVRMSPRSARDQVRMETAAFHTGNPDQATQQVPPPPRSESPADEYEANNPGKKFFVQEEVAGFFEDVLKKHTEKTN